VPLLCGSDGPTQASLLVSCGGSVLLSVEPQAAIPAG
jgi:hypothetical protein